MSIWKTILSYITNSDIEEQIDHWTKRKNNFLNTLDKRQKALYDKCNTDETPLREILLHLEKRIYDLENKDVK